MTFSFSIVYHGKQGLDTFDDGRVNGIYSLKLNQKAVHISVAKKVHAFVDMYWACIFKYKPSTCSQKPAKPPGFVSFEG